MNIIFHIIPESQLAVIDSAQEYFPDEFETDGFIHCSKRSQIEGVLKRHFANQDNLVLLEVNRDLIPSTVRDENLSGGEELYPHIYGALPTSTILKKHYLRRNSDKVFDLSNIVGVDQEALA